MRRSTVLSLSFQKEFKRRFMFIRRRVIVYLGLNWMIKNVSIIKMMLRIHGYIGLCFTLGLPVYNSKARGELGHNCLMFPYHHPCVH